MTTNNSTNNYSPLTTKGDLFGYSTAATRIAAGSNNQIPTYDSTQSAGVLTDYPNFPLTNSCILMSFDGNGGNGAGADNLPVNTQVNGSGASISGDTSVQNGTVMGVMNAQTGSTNTGRAYWASAGTSIFTQGGQIIFETSFQIPVLSNGTDRFIVQAGLTSTVGSGTFADGALFYYSDNVNSGNWECLTAKFGTSGTPHVTTTSTAVTTSETRLKIIIDATCANVYFYVNDTLVATDSTATNMPTSVALRIAVGLTKSVGTNSLNMLIDYMKLRKDFTTPR